jgi:hypothetical protein
MSRTTVEISLTSSNPPSPQATIALSSSIITRKKIPIHGSLTLKHGSLKQHVKLAKTSSRKSLQLTSELASTLGLLSSTHVCISYKPKSKTLHLGPLIGVMVSRYRIKSAERPFGASTLFCKEMTEACQRAGASVFFFTPEDMKKSTATLSGHAYHNGSWLKKTFPIPHVIYNRLTSRRYENLAHVQSFIQHAKSRYKTAIFNEKYLNKTEVFQALRKDESLRRYLPESYLCKNYTMFKAMSNRYESLFLKPITGSLGKGIIKIQKLPNHKYECLTTHPTGVNKQSFSSLRALYQKLSPKLSKQNYQLQQGLHLITVQHRPIDFRALVQRDHAGKWAITSIVGRIASQDQFVSNIARGGSLSKVKTALAQSSVRSNASLISSKLRQATLLIAQGIEDHIPSHFGELGIDLAVDRHQKVWLIEVNSKPSKDDNTAILTEMKIRPSVKNVVKYAQFLSNF